MNRTPFAGLTELLPDDPLTSDDAAFLRRNPRTIDHFIAIGAKTHRHDGHPGVANPGAAPVVLAEAASGTVDPGLRAFFGVTVLDVDGGETLIGPLASATTPPAFTPPTAAPSAAASYAGGTLRADTYYYGVTLLDGQGGETTISPAAIVNRDPGFPSGQVIISNLTATVAASPGATGWAVYRAAAGGQWGYLASGTAATYTDTGVACVDCLREPPTYNTTRKTGRFRVTLPGVIPSGATAIRLYGGLNAPFADPSLVGTYPLASAGADVLVPSMTFAQGAPPPVSSSVGGPDRVDPQNEIGTPVVVPVGAAAWVPAGSGWVAPQLTKIAGRVDLEGTFVGSGVPGTIVGTVPTGYRPKAKYPLDGLVVASARGPHIGFDVLTTGELVLMEPLASGASAAVFITGAWGT